VLSVFRARRALLAGCAVALLAGCTGGGDKSDVGPITVNVMQNALLQPKDVGQTWATPSAPPPTSTLMSFCGSGASSPPIPGGPKVLTAALTDEGDKGAQSLYQIALVYDAAKDAGASLSTLNDAATACPPSVSKPQQQHADGNEAPYTETTTAEPLTSGDWTGFVLVRHKEYDKTYPGTADTAIAVLAKDNALLISDYAIYYVGEHTTGPEFTTDWQRLVKTALDRVKV
jgi:hypothetical protein